MDPSSPLHQVLVDEPPATVAALPDETLATLADLVRAAKRATVELNQQSVDAALRGVPLPLRGVVRKALGS